MVHIQDSEDVTVSDVTGDYGLLAITGPKAREVLAPLTDTSLENENFSWLTGQEIEVAGVPCIALRVSYVGELGWELHHPIDQMPVLYEALLAEGSKHGMTHFGSYAMNVMRIEKGYKALGNELTTEITPVEAGLDRFVVLDREFVGKESVVVRKEKAGSDNSGLEMVLVYASVDVTDSDCRGNEPCYAIDAQEGDAPMGVTTSGTYGHSTGMSLCFAYVDPAFSSPGSQFAITLFGERHTATVLGNPAHDPINERLRA